MKDQCSSPSTRGLGRLVSEYLTSTMSMTRPPPPPPPASQTVFFWINAARRLVSSRAAANAQQASKAGGDAHSSTGQSHGGSFVPRNHGHDSWTGLAHTISVVRRSTGSS
jgi:hypothetical protein